MRRKMVSILLALLCISALLLAACGQSSTTTTTAPAATTTRTTAPIPTAPATTVVAESPRYGGVITQGLSAEITAFDEANTMIPATFALTQEELMTGDWTKGPAGTNEADWIHTGTIRPDLWEGQLAESWESPAVGELIYHLRKGVHWGLNPSNEASRLVNGREMTADDVVFSLKWLMTQPRAYIRTAYPGMSAGAVITAVDKYTVNVKVPPEEYSNALTLIPDLMHIYPPEVIQKYGGMNDWRVSVGTGPFFLTDFVAGSSATFVKNPKYWGTDPLGPGKGNQLPYLDGVKYLIIVDLSTRQAALRTARLDNGGTFAELEDAQAAMTGTSQIQSKKYLGHTGSGIGMKIYKQELPFKDKKVRHALMLATDFVSLKDEFYGGDAEIQSWPNPYQRDYKNIFFPLNQMPQEVQDLYKYTPDRAKALLAEAGYPNGFKTKIICQNLPAQVDFLSAVKEMWKKVGVDLTIDPREQAVYNSIWQGLAYDEMIYGAASGGIGRYYSCNSFDTPAYFNFSQVNDAHVKEVKAQIFDLFNKQDWTGMDKTYKELLPYVLEQAWVIPKPIPYSYILWWPWIKNYHGEMSVGYGQNTWPKYVWLDTDLKEQITGRK
jgi:peptide/nickel transport system substrate-binding protein